MDRKRLPSCCSLQNPTIPQGVKIPIRVETAIMVIIYAGADHEHVNVSYIYRNKPHTHTGTHKSVCLWGSGFRCVISVPSSRPAAKRVDMPVCEWTRKDDATHTHTRDARRVFLVMFSRESSSGGALLRCVCVCVSLARHCWGTVRLFMPKPHQTCKPQRQPLHTHTAESTFTHTHINHKTKHWNMHTY